MFLEKGNTMFLAMELDQTTKEAVEAKGYDYSEFVGFVADEWGEGAFQDLSREELEAGQHYRDAEQAIESYDGSDLLSDWLKHKAVSAEKEWDAAVEAIPKWEIGVDRANSIIDSALLNAFEIPTQYSDDAERWEVALTTLKMILDDPQSFGI